MQWMQGQCWMPGRSGEAHCLTPRPPSRHSQRPWSKTRLVSLWKLRLCWKDIDRIAADNDDQVMVWVRKCIACSPQGQTSCGSRTCSRCCYPPLGETNTSQLSRTLWQGCFLFHLHSKSLTMFIDYQTMGMFRVSRPTVVDCVVGKLSLAEDTGGAPENQICLFIFLSSLLVVARVLRLDLFVGEHPAPAP